MNNHCCVVYTECTKMAAVSHGTSHVITQVYLTPFLKTSVSRGELCEVCSDWLQSACCMDQKTRGFTMTGYPYEKNQKQFHMMHLVVFGE